MVFDTYDSSKYLNNYIDNYVSEGQIVAAACKDECVTNLSEKATNWFKEMGSK